MPIREKARPRTRPRPVGRRLAEIASKTAVLQNLRESIRFQKSEIDKLKREILGDDRNSRSKYIQDFVEEFRDYESISTLDELYQRALEAQLILVGDFHALPSSQEFAAGFVKELARRGARLSLGVEMLYGRNQRALDEWTAGIIDENTFLRRIRYDLEWGYDWSSFKRFFDEARRHHIPIFGIDCDPRTDLRLIRKRDACVAAKLLDLARRHPDRQIVAVFGESHLASGHLPKRLEELRQQADLTRLGGRPLVILQNMDEIYWRLAQQGLERETVVKVNDDTFSVFNATPFIKYEAYRQTLERWRSEQAGDGGEIYLTSTIYNLINTVLDFIRVDKYSYCLNEQGICIEFMVDGYPEVYTHEESAIFKKLLKNVHIPRAQVREILHHTERNGSCYVPPVNAIFIGQFDLVHGAEEAAHFVNFACKNERLGKFRAGPIRGDDLFYMTVMEEALAYFGSKLIAPTRDHFVESHFLKAKVNGHGGHNGIEHHPETTPSALGLRVEDYEFVKKFLATHKHFEVSYTKASRIPGIIPAAIRSRGAKRHWLVHELGYLLGEQLHRAYLQGRISRSEISDLFFNKFDEPGSALSTYLDLAERTAAPEPSAPQTASGSST